MIKTYLKTLWRMFKKHVTRFLSLIFMVLVSVGFISGIGTATDKISYSLSNYYINNNVSDFIIKSKSAAGFSDDDKQAVANLFKGATVTYGNSLDIPVGEKRSIRLYFIDLDEQKWTVNKPDVVDGNKVDSADITQCYAERSSNVIKSYAVDEQINFSDVNDAYKAECERADKQPDFQISAILNMLKPVTVKGIVQSPLTFAKDGSPSYNNEEGVEIDFSTTGTADLDCLENVLYLSKDLMPFMPDGEMYVAVENRQTFNSFSMAYKNFASNGKKAITEQFGKDQTGGDNVAVLTLYDDNYSFRSLHEYNKKVAALGYVLMVAFLLVTALVTLSTMTRLLDEERPQIACLKTLGYSSAGIISKYMLFALIATGAGGGCAYFVGLGLAYLLYYVFNYSFAMPPVSTHVAMLFYLINFVLIVVATIAATAIAGFKMTGERPANLLRPKPPKAGKKVFLEKIPLIWNKLSFKYKSTMRNVLRYKSRFFMTVIAVAVSTALVLAGLALLDLCLFHDFGSSAIVGVSILVVVFAGLLTAVVIYTLTNINISERNREIATLMVLGYHDKEVAGYIYREIYINTAIGIIFGYPLAALLIWCVFKVMTVGVLAEVSWFMWLIAPVIVLLFTALVTLILRRKIVRIHMNESLKAIE